MNFHLPRRLYSVAQVRRMDAQATETEVSGAVLMERAGRSCFTIAKRLWPETCRIAALCGTGNNGGDGFVIARLARLAGIEVTIFLVGKPARIRGDALTMFQRAQDAGVRICQFSPARLLRWCADDRSQGIPTLLIDALLGTGLNRDVLNDTAAAIQWINSSHLPVLAVDIPSGLDADTGRICAHAVHAWCTVTFIGMKQGLVTGTAREHCGQIFFDALELPEILCSSLSPMASTITYDDCKGYLSRRSRVSHKGNFGHVLVVGGDQGFSGAARLAGEGAARTGAGLVSVAAHPDSVISIGSSRPELMVHAMTTPKDLIARCERVSAIALGPGLGQSAWSSVLFDIACATPRPLVLDADALNLLAALIHTDQRLPEDLMGRSDCVYTPHPGEAARWLGCSVAEIEEDRYLAAQALVERSGGTVILKGAGTLIADAKGVDVCLHGNPGMASGGMGDVLSGVIAALIAQGLPVSTAARTGVCLHALAADLASSDQGERGLLASDLFPVIRRLANPSLGGM